MSVLAARSTISRVSVRSDYLAQRIAESASGSIVIDDMLCQVIDDMQSISASEAPLDSEAREHLVIGWFFRLHTDSARGWRYSAATEGESPPDAQQAYQERRFPRLVIV